MADRYAYAPGMKQDGLPAEAARGIDSPPSLLRASAGNLAAAQRRLAERKGLPEARPFNDLGCLTGPKAHIERKALFPGLSNRTSLPRKRTAAPADHGTAAQKIGKRGRCSKREYNNTDLFTASGVRDQQDAKRSPNDLETSSNRVPNDLENQPELLNSIGLGQAAASGGARANHQPSTTNQDDREGLTIAVALATFAPLLEIEEASTTD
ncbi:hypothetical protein [Reyranella soli]|uniref:Uncharacterized protein n=1 Tax=Reyranella soli TaxID=1230389 RepID=A0A512N6C4_9HYPH|nr:hypothetical protein [Reyranella soli]GEP54181.1 hypothetical protein RSO01_13470 [Reyranella soli]